MKLATLSTTNRCINKIFKIGSRDVEIKVAFDISRALRGIEGRDCGGMLRLDVISDKVITCRIDIISCT